MKPSRISIALLVVSLVFTPALFAQAPASESPGVAAPAAAASAAEVPHLIKFSGILLDEQGHALEGPVGLTFALYAQQTGGAALWLETQNVKADANGNYIVLLGANGAQGVPAELFTSGEARWLGVQVEHELEHERILLVSVPYALKAADAETLGGKPASAFALSGTAGNIGNASVSQTIVAPVVGARAPGSSADSASAAIGAITPSTACAAITADGTALANQVAKFSGPCQIHQSLVSDNGTTVSVAGPLNHPAVAAATSTLGQNSFSANFTASSFSSSTHLPVNQMFRWQAEPVGNNTSSPSGKLNLLFSSGTGTPAETGLSINNKGIVTFASGQTIPVVSGNETVTGNFNAGGSISSASAKFTGPVTTGAQTVNGNITETGNISASGTVTGGAGLAAKGNVIVDMLGANLGSVAPGLRFGFANSGEGISSKRSAGGNQFGLDFYTLSMPRMSIANNGAIGIGTVTPAVNLDILGDGIISPAVRISGVGGFGGSGEPSLLLQTTNAGALTTWSIRAGSSNSIRNLRIGTISAPDMLNITPTGNAVLNGQLSTKAVAINGDVPLSSNPRLFMSTFFPGVPTGFTVGYFAIDRPFTVLQMTASTIAQAFNCASDFQIIFGINSGNGVVANQVVASFPQGSNFMNSGPIAVNLAPGTYSFAVSGPTGCQPLSDVNATVEYVMQ